MATQDTYKALLTEHCRINKLLRSLSPDNSEDEKEIGQLMPLYRNTLKRLETLKASIKNGNS